MTERLFCSVCQRWVAILGEDSANGVPIYLTDCPHHTRPVSEMTESTADEVIPTPTPAPVDVEVDGDPLPDWELD